MKPSSIRKVEDTQHSDCSFASEEHLQETLYQGAIKHKTIFIAMALIKQVDKLNGRKVVSDETVRRIKNHFSKNKTVETKDDFSKSKMVSQKAKLSPIKENPEIKVEIDKGKIKSEIMKTEKLKRDMTKGYLKMLTDMNN